MLPRKGRIEWNLNTLVTLAGFAGVLVVWGVSWGSFTAETRALTNAQRENQTRTDERLRSVEEDTQQIGTLNIRVTAVEKKADDTTDAVQALTNAVNNQSGDLKVMREILEQLREAQGLPRRPAR